MRSFNRHSSTIPIDFQLEQLVQAGSEHLKNIGEGGLSFHSKTHIEPGATIRVKIPLIKPVFQAIGEVIWCNREDDGFLIGVHFIDEDDVFRARMVEQICHIEQYKNEMLAKEGRRLNSEEAAKEWIHKFAMRFPRRHSDSN